MNKLKIMTVVGTRPEIIRLSATIKLLDKYTNQVFVHTGQNYDYELNEIFFEDFGLRKPDHFMNVDTNSLGAAIGDIFKKTEEILDIEKPDALLVLGDTNSCLSAYMAKRKHIPIFHMEAGNRSFDFNIPEEVNRRIIDHIADFNLVYTEHARRHLLSEGLQHRRIYLTGSPMWEVLQQNMEKIRSSKILDKLNTKIPNHRSQIAKGKYFVVSIHREENVDNPENLKQILIVLNSLADTFQLPMIVSTHPRTHKRIEILKAKVEKDKRQKGKNKSTKAEVVNINSEGTVNLELGTLNHLIYFMKPFSFTDYVHLQMNALCTISDSGTISEESAMLDFPAISLRQSMERPEAQDAGTIILTGFEPDIVLNAVTIAIEEHKNKVKSIKSEVRSLKSEVRSFKDKEKSFSNFEPNISYPQEYFISNTSWCVLKLILGNTKLSNKWWGIN